MSADATMLYETLYSLASQDTESDLFGTSAPLAQKAFRRAAAGAATPTVWFEVPLSGQPRFDLHVAHSNADLHERAPFAPDAMDGHGELLNWSSWRHTLPAKVCRQSSESSLPICSLRSAIT